MPRLRSRKQDSVIAESSAVKTTNAPPAVATRKGYSTTTSTTTTLRTTRSTRTRPSPAPLSSPPAVAETVAAKSSKSRSKGAAATKSSAAATKKAGQKARLTSASTNKPTKSTRRAAARVAPDADPNLEEESRSPTPSTIIPSTPARFIPNEQEKDDNSPSRSSNAENYSPQSLTSSPPIAQSTPKGNWRMLTLDFSSDFSSNAGYTPPPKKVGSAERPRLQDLEPMTLEPIGIDDDDEDEDEMLRLPTPTPRKPREGRPSGNLFAEEEDEDSVIASTPRLPPRAAPQRPEGGYEFFVGNDPEAFRIYSDPKSIPASPEEEFPKADKATAIDDAIMRPPESSPPSRKRRSSEAGIEPGLGPPSVTPRGKRPCEEPASKSATKMATRATGKAKAAEEAKAAEREKIPNTQDLLKLLPRKNKPSRARNDEDEDEILRGSKVTPKAKKAAVAAKAKRKNTANAKARTTKEETAHPLSSAKKTSKTYTKKQKEKEKAADEMPADEDARPMPNVAVDLKKLGEIKKKFEEVDKWEMVFDDDAQIASSDPNKSQ